MRKSRRDRRRLKPALEGLEDRQLLNARTRLVDGTPINDKDLRRLMVQLSNTYPDGSRVPSSDRRLMYETPSGQTAIVTLYGKGTLKGSTVENGVLNLVYDLTDNSSRIIAQVRGGGVAPLAGIRDANTPVRSPSSAGVNPIAAVVMPRFALVDGGYINLTGGVQEVNLYSLGRHTEVHLVQGFPPEEETINPNQIFSTAANFGEFTFGQAVGSVEADRGALVEASAASGFAATGATIQVGNAGGQPQVPPPSPFPLTGTNKQNEPPPPEGIDFKVTRVDAGPLPSPPLENPRFFAVDPLADLLIRYNANSGVPDLAIPLPSLSTDSPSVGLASVAGFQYVLVGDGSTVYAFDSVSGEPVGSFTVSGTEAEASGLTSIDGIGSNSTVTVFVQAGTPGVAVGIDLASSLASGKAVMVGSAYRPDRELSLVGGATGVSGSEVIYASVAGHFDSAQPNLNQFGMVALTSSASGIREIDRAAIPAGPGGGFINAGPPGDLLPDPASGLGSVEGALARITGVNDQGQNTVTLYNPTSNLAVIGSETLDSPNQLSGLSKSYYPELRNAALVDVQGTLKRFSAEGVVGLVINGRSTVNLVAAGATIDTAVIGKPINHIALSRRQNVQLLSSPRGINGKITRGDVNLRFQPPSIGPVSLP